MAIKRRSIKKDVTKTAKQILVAEEVLRNVHELVVGLAYAPHIYKRKEERVTARQVVSELLFVLMNTLDEDACFAGEAPGAEQLPKLVSDAIHNIVESSVESSDEPPPSFSFNQRPASA